MSTQEEEISRRELLRRPLNWLIDNRIGIIFGGTGLMLYLQHRDLADNKEKIKDASRPIVKKYLEDDLQAGKADNLLILSQLAQKNIYIAVQNKNKELTSSDPILNRPARWNIASIVIGDLLKTPMVTIDEKKTVKEMGMSEFFDFLDNTVGEIEEKTITAAGIEQQANMWTEAVLRSYSLAYSIKDELPRPDGVYLTVSTPSLLGAGLGQQSEFHFIKLQDHSSQK